MHARIPSSQMTITSVPLWMLCGCFTIIVVAIIAAWLVHDIAIKAIAKADPGDIPAVLTGLAWILDRFRGFLPVRNKSYNLPELTSHNKLAAGEKPVDGPTEEGI